MSRVLSPAQAEIFVKLLESIAFWETYDEAGSLALYLWELRALHEWFTTTMLHIKPIFIYLSLFFKQETCPSNITVQYLKIQHTVLKFK